MTKYDTLNSSLAKGNSLSGVKRIIRSVTIAYVISLVFLVILSLVYAYTGVSEGVVFAMTGVLRIVAVIISAILTAKGVNSRGWIWGIASGVCYIGIMHLLGFMIWDDYLINTHISSSIITAIIGGSLGGIIGINIGK